MLSLLAPAKLNLGLEVIGRRNDGYHDIRTVLHTISLFDRIDLFTSDEIAVHVDDAWIAAGPNLVRTAIERYLEISGARRGVTAVLRKRIPAAAGLGGASSDAAAVLLALQRLLPAPVSLEEIATTLGSDIPFFLTGGAASADGRGDVVRPLSPLPDLWGVSVTPVLDLPRKTATLYAALEPGDFSDGEQVAVIARMISHGRRPDSATIPNAFRRALYQRAPLVAELARRMIAAGAPGTAISGAGPTLYTLLPGRADCQRLGASLRAELRGIAAVHCWRTTTTGPLIIETGNAPR